MILEKQECTTPEEVRLQEIKDKALAPWGLTDVEDTLWMLGYIKKLEVDRTILSLVAKSSNNLLLACDGIYEPTKPIPQVEELKDAIELAILTKCLEE
jgi:hypothetical protein